MTPPPPRQDYSWSFGSWFLAASCATALGTIVMVNLTDECKGYEFEVTPLGLQLLRKDVAKMRREADAAQGLPGGMRGAQRHMRTPQVGRQSSRYHGNTMPNSVPFNDEFSFDDDGEY